MIFSKLSRCFLFILRGPKNAGTRIFCYSPLLYALNTSPLLLRASGILCGTIKNDAAGTSPKTRYSGHLNSRLRSWVPKYNQTTGPAYLVGKRNTEKIPDSAQNN